jgi:hypothetical protein
MAPQRWESDVRHTTTRDLLVMVALASLPLAVVGIMARSDSLPVVKAVVIGISLIVPALIGGTWCVCGLARPRNRWKSDLFVLVYIGLTFLSIVSVVTVFMFDRSMAGLLGLGLFGLLAYLSSWV